MTVSKGTQLNVFVQAMAESSPMISVITICYNVADLLEVTIKSMVGQTFKDVEYIIIDGASTDGTLQVVERYRDAIDHFVSEPDGGIYEAMNKGLRRATGRYLCFLNAGDTFHSTTTLEQVFSTLPEGVFPSVIYGETNLVDAERRFLRPREHRTPKHLTFNSFKRGMLVCHQSFYALRALAPTYDEQYRFSGDFDWCLKILKQDKGTHNSGIILTDYLSEGLTTRNRFPSLAERAKIMGKHYGWASTILLHIYFLIRLPFKHLRR